ncbi:SGNH/GDSL hydrolase family protein [Gordonia sp. HY002]|uniref:SGNH/GDSL hydrolase family protein n=1 Tax=Gordonia zhenghanii TaxID=2911516 RepID=UPI001F231A28|nr:SGNH/GDSL hydrolase family protein [Gordonia zhenghanii]MCF8570050.1 SGNH/GDSL hydrolase family protein [Gordonia zhenghanii]
MRDRSKRSLVAAVVVILVVAAGVVWWRADREPSHTAQEPQRHQVHLGDSFASGAGTEPLVDGAQFTCQQSSVNFGQLVAARHDYRLTDVSCAGAWTKSLYEGQYEGVGPQLDAVTPDTDLVTLMLGGNDATLYSTLIGVCARVEPSDQKGAPCRAELGRAPTRAVDDAIEPAVEQALRDIAVRAPRARIVVAGYPWLVPREQSCRPSVRIADGDIAFVRGVQARLNSAIEKAADATGARFVDMAQRSDGHDACAADDVRWIEPMTGTTARVTMHPNEAGQRALADAVDEALGS